MTWKRFVKKTFVYILAIDRMTLKPLTFRNQYAWSIQLVLSSLCTTQDVRHFGNYAIAPQNFYNNFKIENKRAD